jgi:hypothetical protein
MFSLMERLHLEQVDWYTHKSSVTFTGQDPSLSLDKICSWSQDFLVVVGAEADWIQSLSSGCSPQVYKQGKLDLKILHKEILD